MLIIGLGCHGEDGEDGEAGDGDELGDDEHTPQCSTTVQPPEPVELDGCRMSAGELHGCPGIRHAVIECPSTLGVRVVARESSASLISTSELRAWMFHSGPEGFAIEQLPEPLADSNILVSQSDTGELGLLANERGAIPGSPEYFVRRDGDWTSEPADGLPMHLLDFELDATGRPTFWALDGVSFEVVRLTREVLGEWTTTPMPEAEAVDRFGLAPDGTPLRYYYAQAGTWEQLVVADADGLSPLSEPTPTRDYFVPAAPARPTVASSSPRALIVQQSEAGLRVLGEDDFAVVIPSTEPVLETCAVPLSDCASSCHETGGGARPERFAAARSSDGSVWVAWETVAYDHVVEYGKTCDEPDGQGCACVENGTTEVADVFDFHLARVVDGDVDEVLSLEIPPSYAASALRTVDLRAFGDRLAVGLRTDSPSGRTLHLFDLDIADG